MTTLRNFQDVELEVKRTNLEVERLLTDVRLILDRINHIRISDVSTVLPSLVTDHGILSGLGDDDHLQYILVSGTRPFTGDQSHGDLNITNVGDISLDSITADASIITVNNDTTFLGTLTIPDFIFHAGDLDTLINFSDDQIILQAGGKYMLTLTEAAQDLITLGPGSGDVDVDFNGDMFLRGSDGRLAVGLGFTSPDGLVHIHTATAGTVTAAAAADELVLENSGDAGMHILNPDTSISSIYMGSPGDQIGAAIAWLYGAAGATSLMSVGTSSTLGQLSLQTGSGLEAIRIDASQNVGIGIDTIDGLVHIHSGSAGTVSASFAADELVVEGSGLTGISILNPDANKGAVYFGSPSDNIGAQVVWQYGAAGVDQLMAIGTLSASGEISIVSGDNVEAIRVDSAQLVGIGTDPTVELDVLGTITGTTITGANVTSGADPGHAHTGASLSTIDISDDTNLVGGSGITLNDDTLDLDINSLAVATIAAGDFVPFWDITVTADNKKITFANLEGTIDHGNIAGTGDDDHSQYALLAGRAGGQILIGGIASGEDLTLQSTAHATRGSILFGSSAYNEVNNRLGILTAIPQTDFEIATATGGILIGSGITYLGSGGPSVELHGGSPSLFLIETNTTDLNVLLVLDGGDIQFQHRLDNGALDGIPFRIGIAAPNSSFHMLDSGSIGFGIASADGKVHIHTATAGSVTAVGSANELVLENSGDCGLSILAPNTSTSAVVFGSPSDNSGAWVSWNFNSKLLVIGSTTASGEVRINTGAGVQAVYIDSSQNLGIRTSTAFGSGTGVLGIANASANPSTNPSGGGVLYADAGAGKWRSSGGTTTTFGPAEPHCEVCGRDFILEWENKKTGHLIVCMWCLTEKLGEEKWITRVN